MQSTPERERLCYFKFKPRGERSSNSSPPVSPSGTIERQPNAPSPRPVRPAFRDRPQSEPSARHSRVKVQTIEEHVIASSPTHIISEPRSESATTSCKSPTLGSIAPTTPKRTASVASRQTTRSEGHQASVARLGSEASVNPPTRPRPGHAWSRSKSGSIWYERLKQSPDHSHESSQPSNESLSVPKRLLTPLRPPLAPVHGPIYHHTVKVETSFTKLRSDKPSSPVRMGSQTITSSAASKNTSRRSSIDPRKLFTTPLRLVRKFGKQSDKGERTPKTATASPKANSKLQLPDHKSYLRRNQTGEALRQVTSILEQTSPTIAINPLSTRTLSDKSAGGSQDSKKLKHEKKMAKGLALENVISGQKSLPNMLELNVTSQRSSQLGLAPQNTPDERATYKVKRSPSAETEEFLKIDISIRGGTSYLPSEARRIHTPPLPQDGLDGRKRGFFFDYNAPKNDESKDTNDPVISTDLSSDSKIERKLLRRDTSKASTIGRRALTLKRRITTKAKAGDWYDAKLAELETDDDDSQISTPELKHPENRGRSTTETSCSELALARKRKEEEQMDYNIPEHLPSSPLCPRNKRYWRVLQERGSQYRGCWMHGIGEYK